MPVISTAIVERNYLQTSQDIRDIIELEMERLLSEPALAYLVINNNR